MNALQLDIALVHYPVKGKDGSTISTSVTNLDLHDIARSCKTFGVSQFFVVTPIAKQHHLVARILNYWQSDVGNQYNPHRATAFEAVKLVHAIEEIPHFNDYQIAVTGAKLLGDHLSPAQLKAELCARGKKKCLLLFGTGHGLADSLLHSAHYQLSPLRGCAEDGYNHLSVRAAVAIYLNLWCDGPR